MDTLPRLLQFLAQHKVPYWHDVHPVAYTAADLAVADHVPVHSVAKTIVFRSEKGYGMAVLPGDTRVNLNELRAELGAHSLRLATEQELSALFLESCELGAMPPFGNGTLFELPVYVDARLTLEPEIAFNAGTHYDVVRMAYADYARLVQPQLLHFAEAATA
jgi:Ala-tRNA(Pro) deacylase